MERDMGKNCCECCDTATHRYVSTGEYLCSACANYEKETGYAYDISPLNAKKRDWRWTKRAERIGIALALIGFLAVMGIVGYIETLP